MARYLKTDDESKAIKFFVTKYLKNIPTKNDNLQGKFTIKNIRRYRFETEVEVVFQGKIQARIGRKGLSWYGPEILTDKNYKISKVKLNRFIRKSLTKEIEHRLSFFSESIRYYNNIKKITWL